MVEVRNPWGDGEWKGDWSDQSKLWDQHSYVKSSLGYKPREDGAFWMTWEDFLKYYSYVGIVDCNLDIRSVHMPPYETSKIQGPLVGFGKGCLHYWLCCEGPFLYFVNHQASNKKAKKKDFQDKTGCDPSGCYFRMMDRSAIGDKPKPK